MPRNATKVPKPPSSAVVGNDTAIPTVGGGASMMPTNRSSCNSSEECPRDSLGTVVCDNDHPPTIKAIPAKEYAVPWRSMSFSCGGWLQFYLFGVARAIQAAGLDKNVQYCGCSAGALAAAGLALGGDFDAAVEFCKNECIPKAHGHVTGLFQLADYVGKCIDLLMVPRFRLLEHGDLQIAITRLPFFEAERVKTHQSMKDLKQTLLASCSAFPAAPLVNHSVYGLCVDGGLSDFQPIVDADTITVSPFYFSDCDIKPSRYVPPWWAALPPKDCDTIDWTYNLGFDDAMDFFTKKGIAPSPHARPDLSDFRRNRKHPFDKPRKISYHRFLGYNLLNILPSAALSFIFDLGLLVVLLAIWRPLALITVYIELLVRFMCSIAVYIFRELFALLVPVETLQRFFCRHQKVTSATGLVLAAWVDRLASLKPIPGREFENIMTCGSCILSLSLLLRFFSSFNRPSSAELRKHDRLYRCSILYRILRHII